MTNLERNAIAIVGLASMLWGGGLFVAYALREAPAPVTPPPAPVVAPEARAVSSPAVGTKTAPAIVTIAAPPIAKTLAETGLPTLAEKRAHLEAGPTQDVVEPSASGPHGRWEDRTGVLLPTTMPATAVTVHLKDLTVRQALTEVGKAAGIRMVVYPAYVWRQTPFPIVTLDADAKPLLEVINELCAKTGLTAGVRSANWQGMPASADPATPVIGLQPQDVNGGLGPWAVAGPFAFEIQQISHVAALGSPTPAAATGSLTLQLSVEHEPQLVVLGEKLLSDATAATDDAGHTLGFPAAPPRPRPAAPSSGVSMLALLFGMHTASPAPPNVAQWQSISEMLQVPLNCPPDVGRRITRIHLTARFLVQGKSERLEVPVGGGSAVEKSVGGVTVSIGPIGGGGQQSNCLVTYTRGHQSDTEWDDLSAALSHVVPVLVDAHGRALPSPQGNGWSNTGSPISKQFYWYQQQYDGNSTILKPAKLVLDVPTALKIVDVPIEFADLPLP